MYLEKQRELPVKTYDVIVAGGGPAGVGAALRAGRLGLKTLLVERYGFLGGMWTAGYVNPIHDVVGRGGIMADIVSRLKEKGGWGGFYGICFDFELMKLVLDQLLAESGAEVLFHTYIADTWCEKGTVKGIIVENKDGRTALSAKTVIDCTGDGDVAFRAGADYWMGRESDGLCQPMSTLFVLDNVHFEQADSRHLNRLIQEALWERPEPLDVTYTRPWVIGLPNKGQAVMEWIHVRKKSAVNAQELTQAEIEGRGHVFPIVDFLRRRIPGFEKAALASIAPHIGLRESRRIKGLYTLSEEDCLGGAQFADGIANACFGLDLHQPDQIDQDNFHTKPYQIPYRCLVPKDHEGILVAGRCISGTHKAHGSYRVTGPCVSMGEAAAAAAFLAARDGCPLRDVNIPELRAMLEGVYTR